jgi:hypothetical protein
MFKRDPLASAMETSAVNENPRWDEKEEDDAAEKGTNEGIRVFYPSQTCFIYKHVPMGLWRGKAQNILLGFLSADGTEESTYQGKNTYKQKKESRG